MWYSPASALGHLDQLLETAGAVLESVWHRSRAVAGLRVLPGSIVEVFCRCDPETARRRYALRAATREAGHFDAPRTPEELRNEEVAQPVAGGRPVLGVDTNGAVDVTRLIVRIRAAAPGSPGMTGPIAPGSFWYGT